MDQTPLYNVIPEAHQEEGEQQRASGVGICGLGWDLPRPLQLCRVNFTLNISLLGESFNDDVSLFHLPLILYIEGMKINKARTQHINTLSLYFSVTC